jgi:hypothetical protein
MEFVEYRGATPVDDQISVIFRVRHFLDETAYEQTEPVRDGRLPRDWSDDPAPVISLPTTVAPGQVVRVALDASQEIHFPGGMTPAVLGERLAGLSWSFPVTLDFAGGQQQTVRVEAVNPYQFGLPTGAFSADTLEKCQG